MARPRSISHVAAEILGNQAQQLLVESAKRALTDEELGKLKELVTINRLLAFNGEAEKAAETDMSKVVDKLTQQKNASLFPSRGPKSTTKIYDGGDEPEDG